MRSVTSDSPRGSPSSAQSPRRVGPELALLGLGCGGRRAGHPQGLDRIVELGGQPGEHDRHPVAELASLILGAHRHRARRQQRRHRQRVVAEQVAAQGAGAQGEDDVVDRDVERAPDRLHVGERHPGERQLALGHDRPVERGRRRGQRDAALRPVVGRAAAHDAPEGVGGAPDEGADPGGPPQALGGRRGEQLEIGGRRADAVLLVGVLDSRAVRRDRVGVEVEHGVEDLQARRSRPWRCGAP